MSLLGYSRFLILAAALPFLPLSQGIAHEHSEKRAEALETPRFTLFFPNSSSNAGVPIEKLARTTLRVLDKTYEELSTTFNVRPEQKVVFRFLTPEEFRKHTGAPAWTSAMYLRGEVSIPVSKERRLNPIELRRAIRHEYTHAVLAEISGRRCPAWLDEGIAQMMEGDVNPLLAPALVRWATDNNAEAMPLSWLQNGFMTLDERIVPAAYAQSLFASRLLVRLWGYSSIVKYLRNLSLGMDSSTSFRLAFGVSEHQFERTLGLEIARWARSEKQSLRE